MLCILLLTAVGCSGGGSGGSLPAVSAPGTMPLALAAPVATPTPATTPTVVASVASHNAAYAPPPGTQPFASGPFDAIVSQPSVVASSATMIANALVGNANALGQFQFSLAPAGNPIDNGVPIYVAHASDPHYTIHCRYYTNCPLEGHVVAIPKGARPAGNLGYANFTDDGVHDQHLAVRNVDTGREDDLWLAPQPSDSGGTLDIGYGASYDLAGTGTGQAGATAAGFALANGRIRAVDLIAGRIPYALALTSPCENGHVPPAVGDDGGTSAGCPPIGAHIWLDSNAAQIAGSGTSTDFAVVLRAMNEFGGYIVDRCTQCTLGVTLAGGLSSTVFGASSPWQPIANLHPGATPENGVYHLPVDAGTIDLRSHLHVIAN